MNRDNVTLTYPNGLLKSDLLDLYLSAADFGCSQGDYNYEIELALADEADGKPICRWHIDDDDLTVVDDLALENPQARVVVAKVGFRVSHRQIGGPEVFISYAREDEAMADSVSECLSLAGLITWRDKESLFAGQPWKLQIDDAIDRSEFFVALVSSCSVDKEGYVHNELRHAIERQRHMPEGRIFIVPVRLENCEMPHSALREFQYVDLFPNAPQGITNLVNGLRKAHRSRASA